MSLKIAPSELALRTPVSVGPTWRVIHDTHPYSMPARRDRIAWRVPRLSQFLEKCSLHHAIRELLRVAPERESEVAIFDAEPHSVFVLAPVDNVSRAGAFAIFRGARA